MCRNDFRAGRTVIGCSNFSRIAPWRAAGHSPASLASPASRVWRPWRPGPPAVQSSTFRHCTFSVRAMLLVGLGSRHLVRRAPPPPDVENGLPVVHRLFRENQTCTKSWYHFVSPSLGKSQRVKTQRVKTSENFAEEKMFAEDVSEDFSEDRRHHFYWII